MHRLQLEFQAGLTLIGALAALLVLGITSSILLPLGLSCVGMLLGLVRCSQDRGHNHKYHLF